jgi:hypothetical protein
MHDVGIAGCSSGDSVAPMAVVLAVANTVAHNTARNLGVELSLRALSGGQGRNHLLNSLWLNGMLER